MLQKTSLLLMSIGVCLCASSFAEEMPSEETPVHSELQIFLSLPLQKQDALLLRNCMSFLIGKKLDELIASRDEVEMFLETIELIHPVRLIGFIFSDPSMHQQMKVVLNTEIISSFVFLLLENLLREKMEEPFFAKYIYGLERFLNLPNGSLMNYIEEDNYPGLLNFLCYECS